MKYEYYNSNNMVICICKYKDSYIKGVAKCAPEDSFDLEKGKKLARYRCDYKLTRKRLKDILKRYAEACQVFYDVDSHRRYISECFDRYSEEHKLAKKMLKDFESNM